MDCKIYSEKEIAIYEGLTRLMKEGANPYSIKVSDIAKAANIGKGTIYDYFDSKEEAISKSIIYNIINEIKNGFSRVVTKSNFKEKFYEILQIVAESLENNLSTFNMLLSAGGIKEFYEYIVDEKYDLSQFISVINNEVSNLLELGFNESIISTKESDYYRLMTVRGTISGFANYINNKELYKDISMKDAMDTAYRILIKALN
ncbi:TetR/AcrR family transcriptional regulator [Tissierella sp. MB52-C2]|uniref:TetR/AcrR family transcriptional regulator n=1 Tax=Tissierella sp. MB52-C2 TaxID=3070999 RepID=UPI00280B0F11|nr:TetR/AcrR family transcriptional regulator [Tissierella sp. MB52-C2]WMM24123.1 TetR/AcrR family transcriptional regulator [Tissierella sp. MB52-C2]